MNSTASIETQSNNNKRRLLQLPGAKSFYAVIFLNAFIDLGHKITLQNTVFKVHDGSYQVVLIAVINALILLPYILLFFPIGGIANRTPKTHLIRGTAWFALALCVGITFCYAVGWFWPAMAMTLFMAIQSAFFSPAKLSYLRTLFGIDTLSQSNGLAQTVVIAGILFGTVVFSLGFEFIYGASSQVATGGEVVHMLNKNKIVSEMMPLGLGLIVLALLQLKLAYLIPQVNESLQGSSVSIALGQKQTTNESRCGQSNPLHLIVSNKSLLIAALGLALFWAVGQGMLAAFPAYAKAEIGINNVAVVQAVLAASAIGIATGSLLAGRRSRFSVHGINYHLIPYGILGLVIGLWSLLLWQSASAFMFAYFSIGVVSALFMVPLTAHIQRVVGSEELGGAIAGSNVVQNLAMLTMLLLTISFALAEFDARSLILLIAVVATFTGAGLILNLSQLQILLSDETV